MALRNHPQLPATTRTRLQELARLMGYQPNPAAKMLCDYRAGKRPKASLETVAYLRWLSRRSDARTYPHCRYFAGAKRQAQALGFRLDPFWLDDDGLTDRRLQRILIARGIRAVLFASVSARAPAPGLDWDRFCAVRIGPYPSGLPTPCVMSNNFQVSCEAVVRLRDRGFLRIGLIADRKAPAGLLGGYEHASLHHGQGGLVPAFETEWAPPGGRDRVIAAAAVWGRAHRIEALISNFDFTDTEVTALGSAIGRAVPFFSLDLPDGEPGRTGMMQSHELIGGRAIEILAGMVATNQTGLQENPSLIVIDGHWRDAVDAAAATP